MVTINTSTDPEREQFLREHFPDAWADDLPPDEPDPEPAYRFTPGGSFILDTDPEPQALWGRGGEVLLSDGEALIIAAAQGLGKTTLAQQLTLGRCGFAEYADLLGYPITPGRRALYLAMDRPKQAARSFRRMVGDAWRTELDERLTVWPGPPPHDVAKHPSILLRLAEQSGADTLVVDSLKDAAIGLSDDEVGAGYNRGRQLALREGVQMIELHHLRKAPNGSKGAAPDLDDLYGSVWLTSGVGSVILLTGKAGDAIVGLQHLKPPNAEVGPFKVIHNHDTGQSTVWHTTDLLALAKQPGGISARDAARAIHDIDSPTANQKESARRRLEALTKSGALQVVDQGDKITNKPARWGAR